MAVAGYGGPQPRVPALPRVATGSGAEARKWCSARRHSCSAVRLHLRAWHDNAQQGGCLTGPSWPSGLSRRGGRGWQGHRAAASCVLGLSASRLMGATVVRPTRASAVQASCDRKSWFRRRAIVLNHSCGRGRRVRRRNGCAKEAIEGERSMTRANVPC